MHLLVNLTAILDLKNIANPLVHVSPNLWLDLREKHPEHCYGDIGSVETHRGPTGLAYPDIPYHYRIDLRSILGMAGEREGVAVAKDQWMTIAAEPKWRPFCFGGETLGVLAKKAAAEIKEPKGYANFIEHFLYWESVLKEAEPKGADEDTLGRYVMDTALLYQYSDDSNLSYTKFHAAIDYAKSCGDLVPSIDTRGRNGLVYVGSAR